MGSFNNTGAVIIKHANPSGASTNNSAIKAFRDAYISDPISAFGGVVACNFVVNEKIAKEMSKCFLKLYWQKSLIKIIKNFRSKKNLILIDISKFKEKKGYLIKI